MAVGDAGEDCDHFLVAFQRVDVDDAVAARDRCCAGGADEILDAGFGEYISLPFRRCRNDLLTSAVGAAPGSIFSSGQSLAEG